MPVPVRTEPRDFRAGWISNITKSRSVDGYRQPKGFWESPTEVGALESVAGHVLTDTGVGSVHSKYRAQGVNGQSLRLAQVGTVLHRLSKGGELNLILRQDLTDDTRISYTTMSNPSGNEFIFCFNGVDTPFKVRLIANPDSTLDSNTASAIDAGTQLTAAGANFQTNNVGDGFTVNNLTDGSSAYITGVIDENVITHAQLTGGTNNDWEVGDVFNVINLSLVGLERPDTSQVTVALNPGGQNNVKGIVKYFISETQDEAESALSLPSARLNTGADGTRVNLTFDDALYYNNTYRIYRTFADGAAPFLIGEVTVGAATPGATFVDDLLDADLGFPPYAHGDPPPATATCCTTYRGRIYLQDGNNLLWSDLDEPESYFVAPDGNVLIMGDNDGDVGTVIWRDTDGICFGKEGHLYKAVGRTPGEFQVIEILPSDQTVRSIGVPGIAAFTYTEKGVFFYYDRRFYMYQFDQVHRVSRFIEDDIVTLAGVIPDDPWGVVIGRDANEARIWASVGEATFFYDEDLKRFVGSTQHAFRAYLSDETGQGELFYAGGFHSSLEPDLLDEIYLVDYSITHPRDQEVTLLTHAAGGPEIRRFLALDLWMRRIVDTIIKGDILIKIDGEVAIDLSSITFATPTGKLRVRHRLLMDAIGHDVEITITASASDNGTAKMTLYTTALKYQDLVGGTGAMLGN